MRGRSTRVSVSTETSHDAPRLGAVDGDGAVTLPFVHIQQPNDYTCGAAVVAMITGTPIADVIAELRPTPKGGTRYKRMIEALKRCPRIACGDRFVSVRGKPLPAIAVIRITHDAKRVGHVVVKHGRWWFDPILPAPFQGHPPGLTWAGTSRITSSLWFVVAP